MSAEQTLAPTQNPPISSHPAKQLEAEPGMFPLLGDYLIEKLKQHGKIERVEVGTILIEAGAKHFDCFVVLSGRVGIYDPYNDDRQVTEHGPGQFTGDSDMLSQRASIIRAEMVEAGEVLRICEEELRRIIRTLPEASDILLKAFLLRRAHLIAEGGFGARIIGSRYSPDTFRIREFFSRNHLPYTWLDVENDPQAAALLEHFQIQPEDTPIVLTRNQLLLKNPPLEAIASCYGISDHSSQLEYDVVVVGAGPAGLAASVYAASEGLSVLTVDSVGPGGQAGTSSKIENYLGFPTGISGQELAIRAYTQVQKFGGTIAIPRRVTRLACNRRGIFALIFSDGEEIHTRSLVIATGARYRKLNLPELPDYEGKGIYYGATAMEAQTCSNEEIVLVGSGNSAGQGVTFLSRVARKVHLLVRGADLAHSMSKYLINRIEQTPNIEVHFNTQITGLRGSGHLESITCQQDDGTPFDINTQHVFCMIGALPCTDWIEGCVALDAKGFVLTGSQLTREQLEQSGWPLERRPVMLETSKPGIYAVGDVRSESTKRVASAVGEGSMSISFVHAFLGGS